MAKTLKIYYLFHSVLYGNEHLLAFPLSDNQLISLFKNINSISKYTILFDTYAHTSCDTWQLT